MTLEARLHARRGDFRLEAAFAAAPGELLALAGPSGAGKTMSLRLVAGVERLRRGRVAFGGTPWDEPETGVFVTPAARGLGWVPQGGALWPHLDAGGNVAFGVRCRGRSRREARTVASEWLGRVGLEGREGARVDQLSGGQARRVALARALAPGPRVVLLDEPFAGVDVSTKVELRRLVRAAAEGGAAVVVVAHEPLDALALADRVAVLEGGSVVQQGTATELCERPRTDYVAGLAGLNLVRGTGAWREGRPVVDASGITLQVAERVSGAVIVTFAPTAVALYGEPPQGSPRNTIEGRVAEMMPGETRVRVRVEAAIPVVAELTAHAAAALDLRPGDRVFAVVKATELRVEPA